MSCWRQAHRQKIWGAKYTTFLDYNALSNSDVNNFLSSKLRDPCLHWSNMCGNGCRSEKRIIRGPPQFPDFPSQSLSVAHCDLWFDCLISNAVNSGANFAKQDGWVKLWEASHWLHAEYGGQRTNRQHLYNVILLKSCQTFKSRSHFWNWWNWHNKHWKLKTNINISRLKRQPLTVRGGSSIDSVQPTLCRLNDIAVKSSFRWKETSWASNVMLR